MRITKYEMLILIVVVSVAAFTFPHYIRQLLITFSEDYFSYYQIYGSFDEFFFWVIIYYLPAALLIFPKFERREFMISLLYLAFMAFSWWEWFVNPVSRGLLVDAFGYSGLNSPPEIAYELSLFGKKYFAYLHAFIAEVPTWLSVILIFFNKGLTSFSKRHLPNFYRPFPSPKHFAIILISTSWLLVWPTIPSLVVWPFLVFQYHKQGRGIQNSKSFKRLKLTNN